MTLKAGLFFAVLTVGLLQAEEPVFPKQYEPFQGRWRQVAPVGSSVPKSSIPEVLVDVVGRSFVLHGDGVAENCRRTFEYRVPGENEPKPYRYLQERGTGGNFADLVDLPNQITVFWFVGLYRFKHDRLELILKYCGQGVEGKAAENFRPPSSFDSEPPKDVAMICLERVDVNSRDLMMKGDADE